MPKVPQFLQLRSQSEAHIIDEILGGLAQPVAEVSPKHLYDDQGSKLFDAITALDEYYPTRTEAGIMAEHALEIAECFRRICPSAAAGHDLIDLGAGSCAKAAALFDVFQPSRYVAIDISADFLRDALLYQQSRHPHMDMLGVGLDFSASLTVPDTLLRGPALVFYPGSSIGNFAPADARRLLAEARELAAGGALLIGVDLVKPKPVLDAAYDDALGVTAAFNLNLLRHLNRRIGSDFQVPQWRHVAFFDEDRSRIEMHLEAREPLTVRWRGGQRPFAAGERIHTENSWKWRCDSFTALLADAGFEGVRHWTDARGWFGVFLAWG